MSEKVMQGFDEWFDQSIRNMAEAEDPLAVEIVRASRSMLAAAWKVSRESLVVELPKYRMTYNPTEASSDQDYYLDQEHDSAIDLCRREIEKIGLKVKP